MLQVIYMVIAVLLIGIDQATKLWAVDALEINSGKSIEVIDGVFELQCISNEGISWGMLKGYSWIFIPVTIVAMALIVWMLFRSPLRDRRIFGIACTLILAGGIGNLIDRIAYNYVIDFLYVELIDFPIFNFADCCVVIGAILLFAFLLFGLKGEEDTPLRTLLLGIHAKKKERHDG